MLNWLPLRAVYASVHCRVLARGIRCVSVTDRAARLRETENEIARALRAVSALAKPSA